MSALFTHGQPTSGYQSDTSHREEKPLSLSGSLNLTGHNTAKAEKVMICSTSVIRLKAPRF